LLARLYVLVPVFIVLNMLGETSALAAAALFVLYFPVDEGLWSRLQARRRP